MMKKLSYIFIALGILTLSYIGSATLGARLYQAEQSRRFEHALKETGALQPAGLAVSVVEGAPLGRIEIRRVGLTAIIQEGVAEETLRHAVGHIPNTPLPNQRGNVALAGHRDTFFRELRNIRPNDEITLTTLNGAYHYRVETTHVVGPEATEVLDATAEDTLTLVTCYPFNFIGTAPKRFIVRAHKFTP